MMPARVAPAPAAFAFAALLSLPFVAQAAAPPKPAQPAPARAVLLTAPADIPSAQLGRKIATMIGVRVLVTPEGLVDSARATSGDPALRPSAEASARWWVFAPGERREWVPVTVPVSAGTDAADLHPDVLALAREAERSGDLETALASWVGALNRLGTSPVVVNEWAIREHTFALARRISPPPLPGSAVAARARGARNSQLRTVARAAHLELVAQFDTALLAAPWWPEPYLWRAGSLAGAGQAAEALRSLRAYRLASSDTAGVAFAGRLIPRLAAGDETGVCEAIKTWGVTTEQTSR